MNAAKSFQEVHFAGAALHWLRRDGSVPTVFNAAG